VSALPEGDPDGAETDADAEPAADTAGDPVALPPQAAAMSAITAMVAPGKGVRGDLLNVPIDAPPMRSNALVTCECG